MFNTPEALRVAHPVFLQFFLFAGNLNLFKYYVDLTVIIGNALCLLFFHCNLNFVTIFCVGNVKCNLSCQFIAAVIFPEPAVGDKPIANEDSIHFPSTSGQTKLIGVIK